MAGRPENPYETDSAGNAYLGSLVRFVRHQRGFSTVKPLASAVKRNSATISNIEVNNKKPSEILLASIASVLGTNLDVFKNAPLHPRIFESTGTLKASRTVNEPRTTGENIDNIIATNGLSDPEQMLLRQALVSVTLAFCKARQI